MITESNEEDCKGLVEGVKHVDPEAVRPGNSLLSNNKPLMMILHAVLIFNFCVESKSSFQKLFKYKINVVWRIFCWLCQWLQRLLVSSGEPTNAVEHRLAGEQVRWSVPVEHSWWWLDLFKLSRMLVLLMMRMLLEQVCLIFHGADLWQRGEGRWREGWRAWGTFGRSSLDRRSHSTTGTWKPN